MIKKQVCTIQNKGTMPTRSISLLQTPYESLHVLDVLDVLVPKPCNKG